MEKVLIIDDFEPVRKVIKRIVEREKFVALQAADGKEGLEVFELEHPEIVITDLKMPNIDGKGVLCAIKNQHPETEVIVLTGYGDSETANFLLKNGAFSYLKKPLDLHQLVKILADVRKKVKRSDSVLDPAPPVTKSDDDVCVRLTPQGIIQVTWDGNERDKARRFIHDGTKDLALPLAVIDESLRIVFANRVFNRLVGFSAQAIDLNVVSGLISNGVPLANEKRFVDILSDIINKRDSQHDLESLGPIIVFKISILEESKDRPLFVLCFPTGLA